MSNPLLPPGFEGAHLPAQAWSYRVPSPPSVHVPPPRLNARGIPDFQLSQNPQDFEYNGFANIEFLKTVTYDNLVTTNALLDWKYERRRQAQQILPFLFLGPYMAARDSAFLQRESITMVVAVRDTLSAQAKLLGSKAAESLGILSRTVDVAGNQELIAAFPIAIELINQHLSDQFNSRHSQPLNSIGPGSSITTPGKVLVFCETGNERSAALIVAYLMAMYSMECVKAMQFTQAQRFAISIDDPMKHLLQTYESILKAKRDVMRAAESSTHFDTENQTGNGAKPLQHGKRTLNDTYDEMELDNDEDSARFEDRTAIAPFED